MPDHREPRPLRVVARDILVWVWARKQNPRAYGTIWYAIPPPFACYTVGPAAKPPVPVGRRNDVRSGRSGTQEGQAIF